MKYITVLCGGIIMTNSERIRKALQKLCWKEKNMTQSAVAQQVGLNQSYISGIISGKKTKRLPLETMEKIFPDLVVLDWMKTVPLWKKRSFRRWNGWKNVIK